MGCEHTPRALARMLSSARGVRTRRRLDRQPCGSVTVGCLLGTDRSMTGDTQDQCDPLRRSPCTSHQSPEQSLFQRCRDLRSAATPLRSNNVSGIPPLSPRLRALDASIVSWQPRRLVHSHKVRRFNHKPFDSLQFWLNRVRIFLVQCSWHDKPHSLRFHLTILGH